MGFPSRLLFSPQRTSAPQNVKSRLFPTVAVSIRRERRFHFRRKICLFAFTFPAYVHERFFVMLLGNEHVKRRHNEQRENRSDSHSTNKHKTNRISCRSAGAGHERERKVTGDRRHACHHDRTQTNARGLRDGSKFLGVFLLSLVLIFLVLAAQFNSFRDPFIILLGSVPLAMFGAGLFMFLKMPFGQFFTDRWTTSFNIYSQVGLVTLVGLVSKNGILIVQFANELQRQGLTKLAAVARAARIRLRPIMMTSVATVAGHFPLTLVTGAGAAARNSIGLVLVGGMTVGTIFTLFIVPSLYMLIAKEHREKSLMDVGWEGAPEEVDLTPEMAPALASEGDGNGWKQT